MAIDKRQQEIGERIRSAREALGLKQGKVAELVGVSSQQTISNWECGKQSPTLTNLIDLAKVLCVDCDWLLFGTGRMNRNISMRDCCRFLFHTMPTCFDWDWKTSWDNHTSPLENRLPVGQIPQIKFTLSLPTEADFEFYDEETAIPTGYSSIPEPHYQLALFAEIASNAVNAMRYSPWIVNTSALDKAFATIPNSPIADLKQKFPIPSDDGGGITITPFYEVGNHKK